MIIPWKVDILWWTIASLENNVAAKKLPASIASVKSPSKSVFIPSSEIAELDASVFNPYIFESEYQKKSYVKFIWKWFGERRTIVIVRNKNKMKSSFISIVDDTGIHIHSAIQNEVNVTEEAAKENNRNGISIDSKTRILMFRITWLHALVKVSEEFILDNGVHFTIKCVWDESHRNYVHLPNKYDEIFENSSKRYECAHYIEVKNIRRNILKWTSLFEKKQVYLIIQNGKNLHHCSMPLGDRYEKTIAECVDEQTIGVTDKHKYGL